MKRNGYTMQWGHAELCVGLKGGREGEVYTNIHHDWGVLGGGMTGSQYILEKGGWQSRKGACCQSGHRPWLPTAVREGDGSMANQ